MKKSSFLFFVSETNSFLLMTDRKLVLFLYLLLILISYFLFGINISICKHNGFYNKTHDADTHCWSWRKDINLTTCYDPLSQHCSYVNLILSDGTEITITHETIENDLRPIFLKCPEGCLKPSQTYPYIFNMADLLHLRFNNNATLDTVYIRGRTLSPNQFKSLRRAILSCI